MAMQKALYPGGGIDKLFVLRKERGREFVGIKVCVDISTQGLEDNIKMSQERLITAASNRFVNIRTIRTTTKLEKQKIKNSNFMDISSNKLERLHPRKHLQSIGKRAPQERNRNSLNGSLKQYRTDQIY